LPDNNPKKLRLLVAAPVSSPHRSVAHHHPVMRVVFWFAIATVVVWLQCDAFQTAIIRSNPRTNHHHQPLSMPPMQSTTTAAAAAAVLLLAPTPQLVHKNQLRSKDKEEDWLIHMNKKLHGTKLGELHTTIHPSLVFRVMKAWAKINSAEGANMVQMWLYRIEKEVEMGNNFKSLSKEMYILAIDSWIHSGDIRAPSQAETI